MTAHARLSPSNKRWPNCPGSVREEARYPDIPGESAIDGTGSHLLLEMCLKNNVKALAYDQQVIGTGDPDNPNGWLVTPERIARVQMALDYINRRVGELKEQFPGCSVTVESESRSDPGGAFKRDDWWGTCDITITARHPMIPGDAYFIEVADYKDGRGYVSEHNNSQNIAYLFGKMRPFIGEKLVRSAVKGCRMTIIQPKTTPVIRYQCTTQGDITVDSVIESARDLAKAALATDNPDAPLIPGDHCQWCNANPKRGGHCTAKDAQSLEMVGMMNNELFERVITDPKSLTEDQLAELADAEAGIQEVFAKVRSEIQSRVEIGIPVPGWAMKPGRGSNQWNTTEDEVVKKLKARRLKRDDIYTFKLISPAQMKDLTQLDDKQKQRLWNELVTYTEGKMSLQKVAQSNTNEVDSTMFITEVSFF